MANVAIITEAGQIAAANAQPTGPFIDIRSFRVADLGSDGPTSPTTEPPYTPAPSAVALLGTLKIPHTPINNYRVINGTTTAYRCQLDATVGPFLFNEVGLYLADGTLFAIAVLDGNRRQKQKTTGSVVGNTYVIEFLVNIGANGVSSITFQSITEQAASIVELTSLDLVPTASVAAASVYQIRNPDDFGKVITARRKLTDLWDVDRAAVIIGRNTVATVSGPTSANSFQSTDIGDRLNGFLSNRYLLHVTSGAQKGTLRMLTGASLNTVSWSTGYPSPIAIGSTFEILELQDPQNLKSVSAIDKTASEFRFDSVDISGVDRSEAFNIAQSLMFSPSLNGKVWTQFPTKRDWIPKISIACDFLYVLDGAQLNEEVVLTVQVWAFGVGDSPTLGVPTSSQLITLTSDADNTTEVSKHTFNILSSFDEGDFIVVSIQRNSTNSLDTYNGVFKLFNTSFYQDVD